MGFSLRWISPGMLMLERRLLLEDSTFVALCRSNLPSAVSIVCPIVLWPAQFKQTIHMQFQKELNKRKASFSFRKLIQKPLGQVKHSEKAKREKTQEQVKTSNPQRKPTPNRNTQGKKSEPEMAGKFEYWIIHRQSSKWAAQIKKLIHRGDWLDNQPHVWKIQKQE